MREGLHGAWGLSVETRLHARAYLTESVYKVVLQKSVPEQIRELIIYIGNNNRRICAGIDLCTTT